MAALQHGSSDSIHTVGQERALANGCMTERRRMRMELPYR